MFIYLTPTSGHFFDFPIDRIKPPLLRLNQLKKIKQLYINILIFKN